METQLTSPKPTCKFTLANGEVCKRSVRKEGYLCWQHARGFRQSWNALTGNKSVNFVAVLLGLALTVIGLYFGYDAWQRDRQEPNPFHVALTRLPEEKKKIGVFKFDPPKEGWLPQWGNTPPNIVYGVTPGMDLGPAKGQYRFVLIARIEDPPVDENQDETIEKSTAFTIKNEATTLAIPVSQAFLTRVAPQHMVYVSLVLLPTIIEPKQIHKLADVEKLGGGILATNAFTYKVVEVIVVPSHP